MPTTDHTDTLSALRADAARLTARKGRAPGRAAATREVTSELRSLEFGTITPARLHRAAEALDILARVLGEIDDAEVDLRRRWRWVEAAEAEAIGLASQKGWDLARARGFVAREGGALAEHRRQVRAERRDRRPKALPVASRAVHTYIRRRVERGLAWARTTTHGHTLRVGVLPIGRAPEVSSSTSTAYPSALGLPNRHARKAFSVTCSEHVVCCSVLDALASVSDGSSLTIGGLRVTQGRGTSLRVEVLGAGR